MLKAKALLLGSALLALCAVPAAAGPLPLLPLEIGDHWIYFGASGVHQVETITGTRTLLGRTVFVKSYTEGPDAGLENFWFTGPNGEVMLAGFDAAGPGLALAYDPPITVSGGAPSVGDTWTTQTTAYNLADLSVFEAFGITFGALEAVTLSVPAGTFDCIGVGQVPFTKSPAGARMAGIGLALDGRRVALTRSGSSTNTTDWFSPGVGVVQYLAADTFQLAGYGNSTPALATGWGALKVLYR
jgi:hypothetical protein